jgi:hypothetical protein
MRNVSTRNKQTRKVWQMARGSPTITFRIPPLRLAALQAAVARRNKNPLKPPLTISEYINMAIVDKIDHDDRSRRRKVRKEMGFILDNPVTAEAGK